jgi:glycosyltransferase involved in cell wall biosynthesis
VAELLPWPEAVFAPDVVGGGPVPEAGFHPTPLAGPIRSLIVEGWRFLPHSYAMVNQWQLLAFSRRGDIALKHHDAPRYKADWPRSEGVFGPREEQLLASIATAAADEPADLLLRLYFPYDFSPSQARRTAVFGTSELQCVVKAQCRDSQMYERFRRADVPPDVTVVTPSHWSAQGFYKAGFKPEQVLVVPHGVDVATFHPMPSLRAAVRRAIPVTEDEFVFLSVGAVNGSKGIDLLLQAFTTVSRRFPKARLLLKGMNPLYNSRERLLNILKAISPADQERVISRMHYFGNSYSNRKMGLLFQAADAYVSPYRSEGFNLPVLEAAASGLPLICTGGGSTDDFVTDGFARKIKARTKTRMVDDAKWTVLEPDVAHLVALMISAIEDSSWRKAASIAGPAHVRANFTWDLVVDRLVRGLWAWAGRGLRA